jgi:hypothetical protein
MGPVALALIGAGLGALKSAEEKNMWADQQKAEAAKTRYAPWTGQWGQNLAPPTGDMAHMLAGGLAGFDIGSKGDLSKNLGGSSDTETAKLQSTVDDMKAQSINAEPADDVRPADNLYQKQKRYRLLDEEYLRDPDPYSGSMYADILNYRPSSRAH